MLNAADGCEDNLVRVLGTDHYKSGEGEDEDDTASDKEWNFANESDSILSDSEIEDSDVD